MHLSSTFQLHHGEDMKFQMHSKYSFFLHFFPNHTNPSWGLRNWVYSHAQRNLMGYWVFLFYNNFNCGSSAELLCSFWLGLTSIFKQALYSGSMSKLTSFIQLDVPIQQLMLEHRLFLLFLPNILFSLATLVYL